MSDGHTVQLQNWAVCQLCGYCIPMEEATKEAGWLVAPYVKDWKGRTPETPGLNVVRCPRHISERALRASVGRTNEWREIMERGKSWKPPHDPHLSPVPMFD